MSDRMTMGEALEVGIWLDKAPKCLNEQRTAEVRKIIMRVITEAMVEAGVWDESAMKSLEEE